MSLQIKIQEDTKEALKAKDELRLSVLRMLSSAIHNREIEKRTRTGESQLTEEEITGVIRSEAKKRRDAAEGFSIGGRKDLAEKEAAELRILESYLPQELPDGEIKKTVQAVLSDLGEVSIKDTGRIMGEAMKRLKGQASGERVRKFVEEVLKP